MFVYIQFTVKAVKEELLKLPKIVLDNELIVPAGRSFDTMGNKATVQNAKSTSAWVDMRGSKEGAAKDGGDSQSNTPSIAERRRQRRQGGK